MNYIIGGTGAGYSVSYVASSAFSGTNGIKLLTRTVGPAANDIVWLSKRIPLPPSQLVRFRVHTMHPYGGPVAWRCFLLYFYTGDTTYAAEIKLDDSDEKVYYAATIRANYTDTGLTFVEDLNYWNLIDFSFNIQTGFWHKLRVNGQVLDVSGIPLASAAAVNPTGLTLYIEAQTLAAAYLHTNLDHILITSENP
jgi:hypothetical protein